MQLKINGQTREFNTQLNISQLLQQLQLEPERVVIELNTKILPTDARSTALKDGDTLEIIQFVGGG